MTAVDTDFFVGKITKTLFKKQTLYIQGLLHSDSLISPIETFKVNWQGKELQATHQLIKNDGEYHFILTVNPNDRSSGVSHVIEEIKESRIINLFKRIKHLFFRKFPKVHLKIYGRQARKQNALVKVTPILANGAESDSFYGLIPPNLPYPSDNEIKQIGGGDFLEISGEFLSIMIEQGALKKSDHFLDVGCGLGRMAYALAYYLNDSARYEGFDIYLPFIRRAKELVSPYFPNFHFRHVNVWNSFYNPQGNIHSSAFCFPYEKSEFDFVLLTSVFTHMHLQDIHQYLTEIYRVLRTGGRCLLTCFLMTDETKKLIEEKKSTQELIHPLNEHSYVHSLENPEASIGHDEQAMREVITKAGFEIKKILRGSWCGRKKFISYQDILILSKE